MNQQTSDVRPLDFAAEGWDQFRTRGSGQSAISPATRAALARTPTAPAPATGITRLDLPFWDVFCCALKFFVAQAIIAIPALLLWLILLR